jgi:outer membrane receptor protein involved in Fe transport
MIKIKFALTLLFLCTSFLNFSQTRIPGKKIKITGIVIENGNKQPLEYATLTFVNSNNPKMLTGGITNANGEFDLILSSGIYDITVEFISFKPTIIKQQNLQENTNLGQITLNEGASYLNEVVVRAEKSSVEIRLDKKIFNVGQDMILKGGTASDVLNNVPSVTLDSDGNVSLRGNENVKIFIDGKPSNSINIANALKTIPADALDKVEVITNPSARYDAEGGAGILNIILKKGKIKGLNGTATATVGIPQNYGLATNINFKSKNFNLFSTLGYNDSKSVVKSLTNSDYLNPNGTIINTINERDRRERDRKGYNYIFGADWYLSKSLTWTNTLSYTKSDGSNPDTAIFYNYGNETYFVRNRLNKKINKNNEAGYSTNFTKKFKKEGHKFTADFQFFENSDNDSSTIDDYIIGQESNISREITKNYQTQIKKLFQADYVLPIGKKSQFEAGYKGDFSLLITDYSVGTFDANGQIIPNANLTNKLEYKEKINAAYFQFGSKINRFSYLLGMRYEDSNIDINLLTTNEFNKKKYHNFFPSAFLTYQSTNKTSFSINYSRRVTRPRSRFINPFANYSSNVNLFQGNPQINPSFTDAVDFGYMTKWNKITFTSSVYFNKTKDYFQFIKRPNGEIVTSIINNETIETPVIILTPINLSDERRFGFEFNANYSPHKWWRLNWNFNFYESKIRGDYSYPLTKDNEIVNENFNRDALGWFSRISSKMTLPFKIEWQTNAMYKAPQNTAQGKSIGIFTTNMAFSKEVLNNKATISLNTNDLFNSDKIIIQTLLPLVNSYMEYQRKPRQVNLSFTYRFNNQKNEKESTKNRSENGGSGMEF